MALDELGDLSDRAAAVRGHRLHAEPCRRYRGGAAGVGADGAIAPPLLDQLARAAPAGEADEKAPLPPSVAAWVEAHFPVKVSADAEWSDGEVYLPAPRPGGDAWVAIDRATGAVSAEITDRGWISYLNDLHKGRNSGGAWSLFIDIFAFACLVFAITGLFLLQLHAAKRRSTWPIVAAGLAIPAAIAIVSIH